jgi:hypothetical protein
MTDDDGTRKVEETGLAWVRKSLGIPFVTLFVYLGRLVTGVRAGATRMINSEDTVNRLSKPKKALHAP